MNKSVADKQVNKDVELNFISSQWLEYLLYVALLFIVLASFSFDLLS